MATSELTPNAAARFLGTTARTIRALCNDGKLEHRVVLGPSRRRIYIPKTEIRRLKAAQKQARN